MVLRSSLLVVFAVVAVGCGEETSGSGACGPGAFIDTVKIVRDEAMTESEFLQGASMGGVSSDNRRSVTFISEMPLCVCSAMDVKVVGRTTKKDSDFDVNVFVGLVSNAEVTPVDVTEENGAFEWEQDVGLKTKGHGALSYSFTILITYTFPSVGGRRDDATELRRLISGLSSNALFMTFTNDPCTPS